MAASWTYERVMHLITLYRSKPLLWDVTHKEFKSIKNKNEAFEEIAQVLNVSRSDVEAKIHTLRTQFTRERKRIASSATDVVTDIKMWLYYEPLQFLLPANPNDTLDKTDENSLHESELASVYFQYDNSTLEQKTEDDTSDIDLDVVKSEEIDEEYEAEIEQEDVNQSDPFSAYIDDDSRVDDGRHARGKMGVYWTYNRVMHLVKLLRARPLLWNSTSPNYRNRTKRIEANEEIARALKIRTRDVEAKTHGLRTQFNKERKKIAERIKEGVKESELTKWAYYEPLKFLCYAKSSETSIGDNSVDKSASENHAQTSLMALEESSQRSTPEPTPTTSRKKKLKLPLRYRREVESSKNETDDFVVVDDRKKKKIDAMDSYDFYGAYVASELRSVSDEQAATQAKFHINNILYQLKMGHYDKEDSVNLETT